VGACSLLLGAAADDVESGHLLAGVERPPGISQPRSFSKRLRAVPGNSGRRTTRYRVSRLIRTPAFGTIDCAASSGLCIIVVASLDLSQIVTVPIDFDPTVPPLPPVDIDAELELTGKLNLRTGTVTLSGLVTCTIPTPVRITGSIGQQQGEAQISGQVQDGINCVDSKRWSVAVRPNTPGARFRPGTAFADITLGVDRNGPRDRVALHL